MQATKLQTNHLTAPIGMGTGPLFLSWQCTDGMRQTERHIFRMTFLLMARIRVRSAMRASIPLFYEQSPFCSSFSLELYIYKFISYTLLYYRRNRGSFPPQQRFLLVITEVLS